MRHRTPNKECSLRGLKIKTFIVICLALLPVHQSFSEVTTATEAEEAIAEGKLAAEQCYRDLLLAGAKRKIAMDFNYWGMKGLCAGAVQAHMEESGFLPNKWPKPEEPHKGNMGYWYGNAVDFHDRAPTSRQEGKNQEPGFGVLHDLGFRNIIEQYPDDRKCLPGTILVYAGNGKYAKDYQKTGKITKGRLAGESVGHVTVCGDQKDEDGQTNLYFTDGMTEQPALPKRELVGVYTMSECKNCSPDLKRLCEKIETPAGGPR